MLLKTQVRVFQGQDLKPGATLELYGRTFGIVARVEGDWLYYHPCGETKPAPAPAAVPQPPENPPAVQPAGPRRRAFEKPIL